MENHLKQYFREKGLAFQDAGVDEINLEICQLCGDSKWGHFYINAQTGLFHCKKCGGKGTFNHFRKLFGDIELDLTKIPGYREAPKLEEREYKKLNFDTATQYASRLWSLDTELQYYLTEKRKLKEEILKEFKIGSTGRSISIPIYENRQLVNIRYRQDPKKDSTSTGKKYSQEADCKPALFNGDILNNPIKTIYITEGEFDALQLIQRGLRNTVSVTLGAGYFSPLWVEKLKDVQTIYICFDNDDAGISGAKKAAEKLGPDRCFFVRLPNAKGRNKTDITDFFVEDGHTKDDFLELVKNAERMDNFNGEDIKHIHEFGPELREILLTGNHLGINTGFKVFDELLGGLRKGRLVVISGLTNVGKSSFSLNIALNLAKQKTPIFYLSLEMPPIDMVKKFLQLHAKLDSASLKNLVDPSDALKKIDDAFSEFNPVNNGGVPIYLYNGSGVVKYETLAQTARFAKERLGVECIFVDHLHYFATNYAQISAETSKVVRSIKQLAIELDLPIVLLAHLNRGGRTKQRTGLYTPSLADLKDTSTLEQDADQVVFVCRDSEAEIETEKAHTIIKIAKNRDGAAGRSVGMSFDEKTGTFSENDKGAVSQLNAPKNKPMEVTEDLPF